MMIWMVYKCIITNFLEDMFYKKDREFSLYLSFFTDLVSYRAINLSIFAESIIRVLPATIICISSLPAIILIGCPCSPKHNDVVIMF